MAVLYIGGAGIVFGAAVWTIIQVQRRGASGWLVGGLAGIAFSILSMIKLRCIFDAYGCGFMAFTGGFTWHLFPGLLGFGAVWMLSSAVLNGFRKSGWSTWMARLGQSIAPLLGLWIAVIWEIMPVSVIHPPTHDGPCPSLPVICHDVPLLGFGGLAYWTAPFIVWGAVSMWVNTRGALIRATAS